MLLSPGTWPEFDKFKSVLSLVKQTAEASSAMESLGLCDPSRIDSILLSTCSSFAVSRKWSKTPAKAQAAMLGDRLSQGLEAFPMK